jgi:O-antigen/teichoic acid export membrane protein
VKIYSSIDSIILGRLAGNIQVAAYGVPYKFTFAFQFVPIALAAALYPAFTNLIASGKKEKAAELFAGATRYLTLVVMPLVAGMAALAEPLMSKLYGSSYSSSSIILTVLSFSLISAFLDFPVGALLNGSHKQNVQTFWMGITVAVNIILNIVLIPKYGAIGAAFAALAGNFILFFGGLSYVPKIIPVPWKKITVSFAKTALASFVMAMAVKLTQNIIPLPISIIAGIIIFTIAIIMLREVGKGDWDNIKSIFKNTPGPEAINDDTAI